MNKLKYLKWDSEFFNKKIFLLEDFKNKFNKEKFKYDLIQSNVKLDENKKINFLEKNGFNLEELNIKYKKILGEKIEINFEYRKAIKKDMKYLTKFSKFFIQSRFNILGKEKVAEFYSEWIKNSILGDFDDVCFFIEEEAQVAGLITIKNFNNNQARIGLIVVDEKFQGIGVGKKLLKVAEKYCVENNKKELFVTTQGNNIKAQNFYIKNEYLVNEIGVWYYLFKEENE